VFSATFETTAPIKKAELLVSCNAPAPGTLTASMQAGIDVGGVSKAEPAVRHAPPENDHKFGVVATELNGSVTSGGGLGEGAAAAGATQNAPHTSNKKSANPKSRPSTNLDHRPS